MSDELNDLSGPFNPDITYEDFSKEFLIKIMNVWQRAWVNMSQAYYETILEKHGKESADDIALETWSKIAERVNPWYAEVGNIKLNTVLDSLKALQLPLDNIMGGHYKPEYNIIDENHVIVTYRDCISLRAFERRNDIEAIEYCCGKVEPLIIHKYLLNPKIKLTPLKLPPRESPEEMCCQWEFSLDE